ncbi:MAG: hypothetical protein WCP46_03050 [Alphaproteobacteria bacterium]
MFSHYEQYETGKNTYHYKYQNNLDQYHSSHLFYQFIDMLNARHFHAEAEKLLSLARKPKSIENHLIITQIIKEMQNALL